jgi:hypothetical protein
MKRMFRVAVSYTVAVEADSDYDAIVQAQYINPFNPTVRKLSTAVISSWIDKPKVVEAPEVMPAPYPVPVQSVHDAAAGEQTFKDSGSSTYRDPAAQVDDIPF